MSQVTKRICDLCGKEITENIDTGAISINYLNSIGYMNSHNMDLCKDCAPKIKTALKAVLVDLFKVEESSDEVKELDTFFQKESIMQEEMKKYQEEIDKANQGNNESKEDTITDEVNEKEEE